MLDSEFEASKDAYIASGKKPVSRQNRGYSPGMKKTYNTQSQGKDTFPKKLTEVTLPSHDNSYSTR